MLSFSPSKKKKIRSQSNFIFRTPLSPSSMRGMGTWLNVFNNFMMEQGAPAWTSVGKHKVTAGDEMLRGWKLVLIPNYLSHTQLIASALSQQAPRQRSNRGMKQRQEPVLLCWLRLWQKDRWALSSAFDLQSSCRLQKPVQTSTAHFITSSPTLWI